MNRDEARQIVDYAIARHAMLNLLRQGYIDAQVLAMFREWKRYRVVSLNDGSELN